MSNTIDFDVRVKLEDFERQLDQMQSELEGATNRAQASADKMGDLFSKVGKMIGSYFGVQQLAEFGKKVISVRGEMQQLEIAFSTMLGSAEKANALMAQLTETAAKTPFDMNSIANGAKQLLAYGTASEDVNDTLVRLGNIASGLSLPLNDLVYLYGTTQTQGRLFTQDVRQFMGRGIPLVDELSKTLGKTTDEINAMVTAGEIGFEDVRKVIENMTNEGGQFYQLMEKQSASLTGQVSNLGDSIDTMFNEIGKSLQEPLSDGISMVNTLVENYKTLGRVIGTLVSIYGGYNVALRIYNGLQKEGAIRNAIASFLRLQRAVKQATTLQAAFNAVCSVNPYVLLATAIVGVVGAIAMFGNQNAIAERKQQAVNDVLDEAAQKAEAAKNALNEYTSALAGNVEQWKRIAAYENLQGLVKGTVAEKELPSLEDWGRMDAPTMEGWNDYLSTVIEVKKLSEEYKKIKGNGVGSDNEAIAQLNGISERQQELWAEYAKRQEQRGRAVEQATETVVKNKAYYEDLKKKLTSEFENLETNDLTASLKKSYSDRIAQIQKMIDLYDLEADKKKKDAEAQKELNTALKEYQDILDAFAKNEMGTFEAQRFEAYKSYDTTEGKLDEYAKKGVDVSQGRTDNLANLQSTLAKIDEAEREAIADLNDQLTQGTRDAFEQRAKEIEKTYADLAKDVTEQFRNDPALSAMLDEIEKAKQNELNKNDNEWGTTQTETDLQIKKIDLQTDYNNKLLTEKEYKQALYDLEVEELKNNVAKAQNLVDYANTLENVKNLQKAIADLENKESEGVDGDGDGDKDKDKDKGEVKELTSNAILNVASQLEKLSDSLSSLNNNVAEILGGVASGLSTVGSSFGQIYDNIDNLKANGKLDAKGYVNSAMIAAQGILGVMENVFQQIEKNKQVTEAWASACRSAVHELAMARVEALDYDAGDIWGTDSYDEKFDKLSKQAIAIKEESNKAAKALQEEGQVQTGTKTILGWKNAAKDALLGAAAGAAIGSMATPIGTAIGAVAGAVGGFFTGLFAGKEKVAVYDSLSNVYGDIYDENTNTINERLLADYDKLDDKTKELVDDLKELQEKQEEVQEQWNETIKEITDSLTEKMSDALLDAFSNGNVYTAASDLADYVKDTLKSTLSSKVFNSIFGAQIDSLSAHLTDMSNSDIDSMSIAVDVAQQVASISRHYQTYNNMMEQLQDELAKYNITDIFDSDEDSQEALSKSVSSMTEETASKINANFMGLKLTAMEINSQMDKVTTLTSSTNTILNHSLTIQQEIAQNTSYCRNLEAIQSDIRAMKRDGVRLVK